MSRPLTPLALAVLYLLDDGPRHPYETQQLIRERAIDHSVKVTHGSLYHTFERLAGGGLIEPVETSRAGRRPERTVYAITDVGRDEAAEQLRELLMKPVKEYTRFAAALSFATMFRPAEVSELLRRRAIMIEALIATHTTVVDSMIKQGLPRAVLIETEYVLALERAELDFVNALRADIQAGRLDWDPAHKCRHPLQPPHSDDGEVSGRGGGAAG